MPQKRKDLNITGPNLWYLVGLITSDGCLSKDGRHIDITASDRSYLLQLKKVTGLSNKISVKYGANKSIAYRIQFANRAFYDFLLSIGLTAHKSLTLGPLSIAEEYFYDFLRGLIDGDGGIQRWIHKSNKMEQWNLRVCSGSKKFLEWLSNKIKVILGVKGGLYDEGKNRFRLKYGKMAARVIISRCYYKDAFGLKRKVDLGEDCIKSYKGWARSKTVENSGQVVEWLTRQT